MSEGKKKRKRHRRRTLTPVTSPMKTEEIEKKQSKDDSKVDVAEKSVQGSPVKKNKRKKKKRRTSSPQKMQQECEIMQKELPQQQLTLTSKGTMEKETEHSTQKQIQDTVQDTSTKKKKRNKKQRRRSRLEAMEVQQLPTTSKVMLGFCLSPDS